MNNPLQQLYMLQQSQQNLHNYLDKISNSHKGFPQYIPPLPIINYHTPTTQEELAEIKYEASPEGQAEKHQNELRTNIARFICLASGLLMTLSPLCMLDNSTAPIMMKIMIPSIVMMFVSMPFTIYPPCTGYLTRSSCCKKTPEEQSLV